jgi:hypothetical protein
MEQPRQSPADALQSMQKASNYLHYPTDYMKLAFSGLSVLQ